MSAAQVLSGAWGGDAERKQAAIAAVRATLAANPKVTLSPRLRLAAPDQSDGVSNVYCAAFGTDDPVELEARAGLPSDLLRLLSALMSACDEGGIATAARDLPAAALEAIPAGANSVALVRCYMVALLDRIADIRDTDGHVLAPEHAALVRELRSMYAEDAVDPAAFLALRRSAMSAREAATGSLEIAVLEFVESAAWPPASLMGELPVLSGELVASLRSLLSPYQPSSSDRAIKSTVDAKVSALREREAVEPQLDVESELRSLFELPEFVAFRDPAFRLRSAQRERDSAEAFVPFTVDLLIGAFRKA